jgi:hypothetical protein
MGAHVEAAATGCDLRMQQQPSVLDASARTAKSESHFISEIPQSGKNTVSQFPPPHAHSIIRDGRASSNGVATEIQSPQWHTGKL